MAGTTKTMIGAGTILAYSEGTSGPFTYTPLTKVISVNPNTTVGEVEDTVLSTTWGDYLPTIPEGECGFVLRFRPGDAGVKKIQEWTLTPEIVHWKLTYPDGSFETFDGFVKTGNKSFENKVIVDLEVGMRVTGPPVYTEAS